MKSDKIIPGLILVLIGVAFLLANFNVIDFHWGNLWHLWPVFLVIAGINLVLANNRSLWATALKIAVVLAAFALIVFGRYNYDNRWWPGWRHMHYSYNSNDNDNDNDNSDDNNNDDDDDSDSSHNGDKTANTFATAFKPGTTTAKLNINGAATQYNLSDTSSQLIDIRTEQNFNHYHLNTRQDGNNATVDFKMESHTDHMQWDDKNHSNVANIKLNPTPEWDFNIDAAATQFQFDLTKFKVRSVSVHGAAGDFNIKLGAPLDNTDVEVNNAAASVKIAIPQNAACEIEMHTFLTDHHFDGFTKGDDGNYRTPGFDQAANKIHVRINGAMANFTVSRY